MPKVNIYLPSGLSHEARAANLSLSQICQTAIREELAKVQAKQAATSDLEAVVARLRATVDEEEREEEREGRKDGIQWAREYATAADLRYIAGDDFEPGRGGDFDRDSFPSLCEFVGDKEHENIVRVRTEDSAYWHGFVAGANDVLLAVAPLL